MLGRLLICVVVGQGPAVLPADAWWVGYVVGFFSSTFPVLLPFSWEMAWHYHSMVDRAVKSWLNLSDKFFSVPSDGSLHNSLGFVWLAGGQVVVGYWMLTATKLINNNGKIINCQKKPQKNMRKSCCLRDRIFEKWKSQWLMESTCMEVEIGVIVWYTMTKPTKWLCAQRRLWSAWASAQSDQSLRCRHEESLGP